MSLFLKQFIKFRLIASVLLMFNLVFITQLSAQKLDWLEDQPSVSKALRVQTNKFSGIDSYPRRSIGSIKNGKITPEQMACYDLICAKILNVETIIKAQTINPNLSFLRIFSPQAWQGSQEAPDKQGNGYPFNTTGPATANNQFFAGHWAYKPFTKLTASIGKDVNQSLSVENAENIAVGSHFYVVRPAQADWSKAEHLRITKTADGKMMIDERGYKSEISEWPAGSVIAMHQAGNGAGNKNWVFNHSIACPKDANGKRTCEALADWLAENYDEDPDGKATSAQVDGILYDADPNAFIDGGGIKTRNADLDNDGIADWGFAADGTNHWGEGLEVFYQRVRSNLDKRGRKNAIILGGVAESWGILPNNGTQMEAAWSHQFGEEGAKAKNYKFVNFYFSGMKAQTAKGEIYPRVSDIQGKEASAIYPGKSGETRNEPVLFSYAMTMLFDGAWFSNQNGFDDAFHYFDEDAVYIQKGENFGKSVPKANTADILKNNKWLGKALGTYQRIYDASRFSKKMNLLTFGDFELANELNLKTKKASASVVNNKSYEGKSSLLITPIKPNTNFQMNGASASCGSLTLQANKEYTLCFAINSEVPARKIRIVCGSYAQDIFITPGWNKHVISWKQEKEESTFLTFEVGLELTPIWVDQLGLYEGGAEVLRRDFEHGIVLANASAVSKTIDLKGKYRRIAGNLDKVANNGQLVTEVTLAPYDGLFLVKE